MRIAFVVHDYNRVFGHSRYVAELASRFVRDHDVHVFANTFDAVPSGVAHHRVPAWRRSAVTTIYSFLASAALLVRGRFDIVHAQGLCAPFANVVTAHICNGRWLEGREAAANERLPWRERTFGRLVVPLERRQLRSSRATVIAISRSLRDDLRDLYGREDETVVIHHGVDSVQFNPEVRERHRHPVRARLDIPADTPVFLFVGDLRKGFEQAIDALPGAHGLLLAVSRSSGSAYLTHAQRRGVAGRVRVLPPTVRIEEIYGAADVFVYPTPYDAFGMVVTEAMACGLPVITSRHAGAAELIRHGVNGLLLEESSDAGGLGAAMQALASDPVRRDALGRAAAEAMRTQSWDQVAARTLAVYERVVATSRAVALSPSS